jgi:prepilin-type N-terminal cleavage/methylation domain-containing protein
MNASARRGFTLVELLVVVVLGGFIVLATYQVLITNSRTYSVNNARIQGQQNLRAGLDVLFGELRELSTPQGDLLGMGQDTVAFRAQRTLGLVCQVDYTTSPPTLSTYNFGTDVADFLVPEFAAGDTIFLFYDNNPDRANDDEWHIGVVSAVGSADCDGDGTFTDQTLRIPQVTTWATAADPDSVRNGAVVRGFDLYTYGLYTIGGEPFLARKATPSSQPEPLVGPLLPGTGVEFTYMDSLGVATATPTSVAQIQVILRYQSAVRNAEGDLVSDSIVARVYPRN